MKSVDRRADVIFVGGTRFSGADAVAGLLAERPSVGRVPAAIRFHSDPWGVPALLHGRIGLADFAERLRGGEIAEQLPRERLDAALAALRDGYEADPLRSCRELFWSLVHDLAGDPAYEALVDASPGNLVEAHTLTRLVPDARFVHVVRDGRDVAAAAVASSALADRLPAGLEWWAGELREIERGVRGEEDGAQYAIPDERPAVVALDELASAEGDAAYRGLLTRIGLGEDGSVAISTSATYPAAIGRGRWRSEARGPLRWLAGRRYERILQALESEGNHAAPALRRAYERFG